MFKKIILTGLIIFTAFFCAVERMPVHASSKIFENMAGKWRGKGLVKAAVKGREESIRCRMNNSIGEQKKRLEMGGLCAVSGFVFSLKGYIQQDGNRNTYSASMFRSLVDMSQGDFSGKRRGNRIDFNFKATNRSNKKTLVANIRLNSKSDKAFDVQISRSDPATGKIFKIGTINFAKK